MKKNFKEYVREEYQKECFFIRDNPDCETTMWNWWFGYIEGPNE